MYRSGTQRILAWVSSASATQTRACAAATISGRASESRKAVARLIGKRTSVSSNGAKLSCGRVARGEGGVAVGALAPGVRAGGAGLDGTVGGKAGTP